MSGEDGEEERSRPGRDTRRTLPDPISSCCFGNTWLVWVRKEPCLHSCEEAASRAVMRQLACGGQALLRNLPGASPAPFLPLSTLPKCGGQLCPPTQGLVALTALL